MKKMIKVPKKVADELGGKSLYRVSKLWFNGSFTKKLTETNNWLIGNPRLYTPEEKLNFLATLLVNGYDIEEEEEGVVLIDIPNPYLKYTFIKCGMDCKDKYAACHTDVIAVLLEYAARFTKEEAKEKFPNFRWVSLDDLDSKEKNEER